MATAISANCVDTRFIMDRVLEDIGGPALGYNIFQSGVLNSIRSSLQYPGVSTVDTQALQILPTEDGQTCRYQVWFWPPECGESEECDGEEDLCPTETNKDRSKQCAYPTMSACIKDGFSQTLPEYRCVVEGQTFHFTDNLRRVYDRMKRAVNSRYRAQLIANLGTYVTLDGDDAEVDSSTDPRDVYYPTDYGSTNRWVGFTPISNEYGAAGLTLSPYVVGGSAVLNYVNQQKMKEGNGSYAPFNVFYDPQVDSDLGSDKLISFVPGTVTPLWWTDAKPGAPPVWNTSLKTRDAFDLGAVFGEPGFVVERIIQYSDCTEKITYSFKLNTDLFTIPDEAYNNTTCNQRSNLILQWAASCSEYGCGDLLSGGVIAPETT